MAKTITGMYYLNLNSICEDIDTNGKSMCPMILSYLVTDMDTGESSNLNFYQIYVDKVNYIDNLELQYVDYGDLFKNVLQIDNLYLPVYKINNKSIYTLSNSYAMYETFLDESWFSYLKDFLAVSHDTNMVTKQDYDNIIDYKEYFGFISSQDTVNNTLVAEEFVENKNNKQLIQNNVNIVEEPELKQEADIPLDEIQKSDVNTVENITVNNNLDNSDTDPVEIELKEMFNTPEQEIDLDLESKDIGLNIFSSENSIITVATPEDIPKHKGLGQLPDRVNFTETKDNSVKKQVKLLNNGVIPLNTGW